MAENDQDLELDVEGGGGSKKLIIIIAIAVILLGGGGAAAFFLMGDDSAAEDQSEQSDGAVVERADAIYVGVPETIMSPVKGDKKDRLVQIKMSMMTRSPDSEEQIKKHMPRLKNNLLELVSQQSADEILTPDGRRALQEKALEVAQQTMTDATGESHIETLLFVSFVMQ